MLQKTRFFRRSLNSKLMLLITSVFLVTLIVSFTLTALIFNLREQIHSNDGIYDTQKRIEQTVDSYMEAMDMEANTVMFSSWVQKFFSTVSQSKNSQRYLYRNDVADFLSTFSAMNQEMDCFLIVSPGYYVKNNNSYQLDYNYSITEEDWFTQLEQEGKYRFYGKHPIYIKNGDQRSYTTFYVNKSIYSQKPIGYFVVTIPYRNFSILSQLLNQDERTLIRDQEGTIVYTNMTKDEIEDLPDIKEGISSSEGSKQIRHDVLDKQGWEIWTTREKVTVWMSVKKNYYFFVIMIPVLILFMLCTMFFSRYLTKPIVSCTHALREIRNQNYEVRIPNGYRDEIGDMIDGFNDMSANIHHLLELNEAMYYARQQAEFLILQQRINPHFLCNTLEIVNGMILCDENDKALELIGMLGKMYRYDLGESEFAYVADEVKYLKNYLSILSYKYRDLQVDYDIDDCILEYRMPKYICQPLVENTFKHGFSTAASCYLSVSMKEEEREGGRRLNIIIRDNGQGMEEAVAQEIQKKIQMLKEDHTIELEEHIGILNTARRIFLHYGKDSLFKIHSAKEKGTEIQISIPMKEDITKY